MKKALIILFLFIIETINAQNIGIGTATPDASAQLDVNSTTRGFLPPRMTTAQRLAIGSPAEGLLVYQAESPTGLYIFKGASWKRLLENTTSTFEGALPIVSICCQHWMTKNLDVDTYRNGDPIPHVTNSGTWTTLTTGAYCYYNNDSATYAAIYGKLYNWYAVNDPRGLAPKGWHMPTDFELTTLANCLGGATEAGGMMKLEGVPPWTTPNTSATNRSAWSGLPGGSRTNYGFFQELGDYGNWWGSAEFNPDIAMYSQLSYISASLFKYFNFKNFGFSVRCIRD